MFGKLNWSAIPIDQPIPMITSAVVAFGILGILAWVVLKGHLPYLWEEWITSVDHKRIGVMYMLLASVMLLRGFADAIMMRGQQAVAFHSNGYLPPEHFNQIFSAHGTIMIFFVAMPFVIGLMNLVVPLQLGVRDVAFPTLNSVGFWLTATGALLVNISLVIGEFARTGWLPYPPLSELTYSPGVGVDYYLWSLEISGVGTLVAGINLVTTVLKLRTRGMELMRMPMFCWTTLASNLLIVAAFPILTATLAMLILDRYFGFHFFTNEAGGNVMMFMNLIWAWGHPEVYILILPAFGVFSEVVSTFSGKPLFGYRSMVLATMAICVISFMVWLHHFFTMGAGPDVNAIFGIASMIIAVPTGVKIYNWLFTMYGGRIRFTTPMLWSLGFMVTFIIGGLTGVLVAVPPADFMLHNSLFLVAHFHNVIIGGVLFGAFAGYTYWFPKAFGFRLHEGYGKAAFWFWLIGFYVAFMPLYAVGMLGMTRRMQHYDVPEWRPWLIVAAFGAVLILIGIICQIVQLVVSIRDREAIARPHRRPLERAVAGMGHRLAAAGVQFRDSPRGARRGCVLDDETAGAAAGNRQGRAGLPGHRNAAQFPDRICLRILRHHHGLRADLAHLVDGRRRIRRRVRDLRGVRLARPRRIRHPRRGSRAHRPRQPGGAARPSRHRRECVDDRRDHDIRRERPASFAGRRARRSRLQARRHRLRLLDLHPQRHGDVLGLLRDLRRAARADGGRAERGPAVRSAQCRDRDRISAGVELYLRACHHRGRRPQQVLVPDRDGGDLRFRARLSHHRSQGIRKPRRPRRRADAQRVPVGVLHAGRLPRTARLGRHSLAADDDGAGLRQGIPRRYPAPPVVLRAVLARARHHLDRRVHRGLSARECRMTNGHEGIDHNIDIAPGDENLEGGIGERVLGYLAGLGLAILLTATSFFVAGTDLVWQPSIPVALVVLAIAQMGVHLVFFLHITTGADNANNVLALAFGVLIVLLVIGGSLWIMANLNHNMMPMDQLMQMQR